MSTAVKRACDACHRRKVKCDGINPCRNCSSAQLTCTYNAIPQKKGPKGSRAKVISELRETQRQSLSAKVHGRLNGMGSPPCSPTLAPTPGLLTGEMVKDCVEFFFANMYPTMPILSRQRLEQLVAYPEQARNLDAYCLLTSLAAFVMLQPGMTAPGGDPLGLDVLPGANNIVSSQLLLEETIRVRRGLDYLTTPTLNALCTNYFLFACHYGLELHDKAWFYLREAATLIHIIGMDREEHYARYDSVESSRRRRLYWLIFVAERAYALQRRRPVTLQATINLPAVGDDPSDPLAHRIGGFVELADLFRPFDDAFLARWTKMRADFQPSYLVALQKQLGDVLPAYVVNCGDPLADLHSNQQWLKTVTWQLGMQDSCARKPAGGAGGGDDAANMHYQYGVDLSREIMSIMSQFTTSNMEVLEVGLIGKLLDVACNLTGVLSMQPASRDPFAVGPREHLRQLLNMLSVIRGGDHRFLPLILNKLHEVLPRLANPMLQNPPENSAALANLANIDIFDGFGNLGMAPPPMMPMDDYEKKYQVPDLHHHPERGASTGAPGPADTSSPFSSGMVTPGVEFSRGMQDFNTMTDMVMSPVPATPGSTVGQPPPAANPQPTQHHNLSPPMQNGGIPGMGQPPGLGISAINPHGLAHPPAMSGLPGMAPHRPPANFAVAPPIPRTVGEYQALRQVKTENLAVCPVGVGAVTAAEIDFGALR